MKVYVVFNDVPGERNDILDVYDNEDAAIEHTDSEDWTNYNEYTVKKGYGE